MTPRPSPALDVTPRTLHSMRGAIAVVLIVGTAILVSFSPDGVCAARALQHVPSAPALLDRAELGHVEVTCDSPSPGALIGQVSSPARDHQPAIDVPAGLRSTTHHADPQRWSPTIEITRGFRVATRAILRI